MKKLLTILAFLPLAVCLSAQDTQLTIENQSVSGTDFFFDIYLTRTNAGNELYLGDSDFVLSFNLANFTNPVLSREPDPSFEGNCTFVPTVPSQASGTRENYYGGTSPTIIGDRLIVNLSVPDPTSQFVFDNRIARIENTSSTHRLGTFKLSGISTSNGTAGLQWETTGGNQTQVFTHSTADPWPTSQVNIVTVNPTSFPLPVTLTAITATPRENSIMVDWETEDEVNLSGYEVQRSTDGKDFSKIAFQTAEKSRAYQYEDKDVTAGVTYYYRLKMVDYDESFQYSPVRSAKIKGDTFDQLSISPNPAKDFTKINFNAPQEGNYKLELYNEKGASIFQKNYELSSGENSIMLNTGRFSTGSYIVKIKAGDEVLSGKLIMAE